MGYWLRRRSVGLPGLLVVLSALAGWSVASPALAQSRPSQATADALDQKLLAAAKDNSQIMTNLRYLSDVIGARLTGSAALKRANEWTADRMRDYGLVNVHLEPWSIPVGWERGTAYARLLEPDNGLVLSVAALGWSPGTNGRIEGDVVALSARNTAELKAYKGKLKNAIVLGTAPANVPPINDRGDQRRPGTPGDNRGLMNRDMNQFRQMMEFRREMTEFLRAEGVAAVFMDSAKPQGLLNMTGSWRGGDRASAGDPVPTLFVAHEHYALLHRLASRSAPARTRLALEVHNRFIPGPIVVYNTVGEVRGSEKPDEVVVIGGHLDSWDLGQGTTDNGTGTCVALEAARILAHCGVAPKRTIRCILFTGEEQGMRGSHAYVEQHKSELPRISMCVVHDLGTGKVTGLGLMGRQSLQPILEKELASLKPLGVTQMSLARMGGSDHASFDQAGVPGFYFLQDPAEYRLTHHSQSDTLDKAHEADLIQGAQTMAVLAMRIANRPGLLPRETVPSDQAGRRVATGYQRPPRAVTDILDVLPPPILSVSPTHAHLALLQPSAYPTIAELAEPMLRLAGHRINPNTNGPSRPPRFIGISLRTLTGEAKPLALPANAHLGMGSWSPDGKQLAFTNTTADAVELWIADVETAQARRIPNVRLNACSGQPIHWLPDSNTLLCQTVVANRGQAPAASKVPAGPTIQESDGKKSPVWTFQDLLKNRHDEDLFDYYFTARLALIDSQSGNARAVGDPAVFGTVQVSPDGNHVLVAREHRPYSYQLPSFAFPKEVEIWDRQGKVEFKVASLPLADQVPIDGVPTGPRAYEWRPTEPATLLWVEALDGGDPKKKVAHRDKVLMLASPFQGQPSEVAQTEHRFAGIQWGENRDTALLRDYDRDHRRGRTFILDVDHPKSAPRVLWDRSVLDRYGDPGNPVLKTLPSGQQVIWQDGRDIFLNGRGASPSGEHPFLYRFNLDSRNADRLFKSDPDVYESVAALISDDPPRFITRRESPHETPNYWLRSVADTSRQALTHFTDPTPQLRSITKQLVTYNRPDGVKLSFTLYLPPGYKPGERLPTIVWAYPLEFTDAGTASQVTGSANHFTALGGISHLFLLTQGYAILDGATMPVVGDPETVNNTYLEQIVASAKAAIDEAVDMGVTDRNRVGVGGHSYGAFMTANLLAHSDLFRAGVARSGAYNRTLTPFGFQSERRTMWEAPDMYLRVSPFMYAHKIKTPLLLIHGEADNNSGTFPIQSERMYQAIKGNGGTVRFVSLPLESHGYQARESVEHTLYEMITWFDKYVKNADSRATATR
jgi:dipeptidyl aminopeptidase/acylaminoacyl peptidase